MAKKKDFLKLADAFKKTINSTEEASRSLEHFYRVRKDVPLKTKRVHTYEFNDAIHKEQGLILVPITDVHLGHRECNIELFEGYIDYILNTPNAVTILNGDLAETATKVSVGKGMFEESMSFPEQMKELERLLLPLAEAGKILGCGPGNHEERIANLIGINPMEMLADKLNVPYFGYQGFFRVKVAEQMYKIVAFHGAGGGATVGSKANTAEKMNKVLANADLYISGHTHGRQSHTDLVFLMDEASEHIVPHKRTYVVGGSFIDYWDSYPEMKGLAPALTGLVRCELRADGKEIRIDI